VIGLRIHNYEIRSLLGSGSTGEVYLAVHLWLGRRAAVKVLKAAMSADRGVLARFLDEVRSARAIRHPNVADLFDVGSLADGRPYLMMEYLDGEPLSARLSRTGRLPWAEARPIVDGVAGAVALAHGQGNLHLELRPENIFLCPDASQGQLVKILDFGISRLRDQLASSAIDAAGALSPSVAYLAPEQQQGLPTDERTDVYALGAILYHLVCGAPPYLAEDSSDRPPAKTEEPLRPPRTIDPSIPATVEAIAVRALARRPEDRFATVAALVEALDGTPSGKNSRGMRGLATAPRPGRWLLVRMAAVGIGLGAALVFLPPHLASIQPSRRAAALPAERPAPAAPAVPAVCPEIPPQTDCARQPPARVPEVGGRRRNLRRPPAFGKDLPKW
jgi:eukaryotic-like serine/threonine-protein kinase